MGGKNEAGMLQAGLVGWELSRTAGSEGAGHRRVLVADDSALMRRTLEALLGRWGFEVLSAADGHQAWRLLNGASPPPLAILDWMMPGLSGPELCRRVRNRTEPPYIYVILLTGRSERADVVKGLEAGADDYVVKPFDAAELEVRLRAGWRVVELEQRLRETRDELERLATRDPLTGVFNRRAILEQLEQALARARRLGEAVGVLMIDLDGFKQCNDGQGHLRGDAVLVEFARRVRAVVRSQDLLGRYGGDEFLLVAPGCSEADLAGLAERIRQAVGAEPFPASDGGLRLTASVGAAAAAADSRLEAASLLRAADEALYAAKREGRNRVVLVSVTAHAVTRLSIRPARHRSSRHGWPQSC